MSNTRATMAPSVDGAPREPLELLVVEGWGAGTAFPLDAPTVVIGREAHLDVCIDDPTVSRRHARLFEADGTWWLEDRESRNGTFLNGRPVEDRRAVAPGDAIRCGGITLRLVTANAHERHLAERQRLETVGRIAPGIAHDVRNVLAVVRAGIDHLRSTATSPERLREWLDDMAGAVIRGTELTTRLLDAGAARPSRGPLDLAQLCAETGQLLRHALGPDIEVRVTTEAPLRVYGSAAELSQVLMNLGVNARDAMPDGGELTITARVITAFRRIEVAVRDTGAGIPVDMMGRIFEPFFTTKESGELGGTGLGLAISRRIVERHGGELTATSAVGRGTTFRLTLPALEDASPGAPTEEAAR